MSKDDSLSVKTKRGEITVSVDSGRLLKAEGPSVVSGKNERKFNIRIRQDDIALLDALATLNGTTRSSLINDILHSQMRDELMSIKDDDARTMLAHTADQLASYDSISQPWVYDALEADFAYMLRNMLNDGHVQDRQPEPGYDNHTVAYYGLRDRLQGMTK
jgi:hypothetical protein